ncbi:host-nuclease inhibitor Gam family protein [Planctomicrobium sp. SH661]|uniref:host-nuclease inhibitor Gam family protein n=1 Tax=Planctomicrobium sp. SH661 TaxID=3448124 RepID=UPI003F5C5205
MNTQEITRPAKHLGAEPTITSDAQLQLALQWYRFLTAVEKQAEATYERAEQLAAVQKSEDLAIRIGRERTTAPDYRTLLESAITKYSQAEYDRLYAAGKTFKTPLGSIRSTAQPEKVHLPEGTKDKDLVERLLKEFDFQPEIDRLKEEFPDLFQFLKLNFALDRQSILEAWQAKQLEVSQLEEYGITIKSDPEKVTVIL